MRRRRTQTALLIIVTLLLVACSTNPTNRWAQARSTLTRAQDTVLFLHQAGVVDDATLLKADPIAKAARAALDKAELALPEGGAGFDHYLGIVDSMLDRLIVMGASGTLPGD